MRRARFVDWLRGFVALLWLCRRLFARPGLGWLGLAAVLTTTPIGATPRLFDQTTDHARERLEPNALVMLRGAAIARGDEVWYRSTRVGSTAQRLAIHDHAALPHALWVRMRADVGPAESGEFWLRRAGQPDSPRLLVGAPRPRWFGPRAVHRSAVGAQRRLYVVGDHLAGRLRARLRNTTAAPIEMQRLPASATAAPYVAEFTLPVSLARGDYVVEVAVGSAAYARLPGSLRIDDEAPGQIGWPAQCRVDDRDDDAVCLRAALARAAQERGVIRLPPGTLRLRDVGSGFVVAPGVSIRGAGRERTRLLVEASSLPAALFELLGDNRLVDFAVIVAGPTHADAPPTAGIRLGPSTPTARAVTDIELRGLALQGVAHGVVGNGGPLERVAITDNLLAAQRDGILLDARRDRPELGFVLRDALILGNRFAPGGYLDCAQGQGAIASQIGASERLLFVDNEADGLDRQGLGPRDAPGWRAAFFWHLLGAQRDLVVLRNRASCTADKAGDGEFLAFDNNGATMPFGGVARTVRGAGSNHIEVAAREGGGDLVARWHGAAVHPRQFVGHTVFVAAGTGLGQVRTVTAVTTSAAGLWRLQVAPAFARPPSPGDRIALTRAFERLLVLDNRVDQSRCAGSNANRLETGGAIVLWASSHNAVIAGNRLRAAGGIVVRTHIDVASNDAFLQYGTVVRDNDIDGEPRAESACSAGGIQLAYGGRSWRDGPAPRMLPNTPLTLGYGTRVTGNRIRGADATTGGAIAFTPVWHRPPGPLFFATLIDRNFVDSPPLMPARPGPRDPCRGTPCGNYQPRRGVGVLIGDAAPIALVLDRNRMAGVAIPQFTSRDGSWLSTASTLFGYSNRTQSGGSARPPSQAYTAAIRPARACQS